MNREHSADAPSGSSSFISLANTIRAARALFIKLEICKAYRDLPLFGNQGNQTQYTSHLSLWLGEGRHVSHENYRQKICFTDAK